MFLRLLLKKQKQLKVLVENHQEMGAKKKKKNKIF
jgi:hypothetical protein